MSAFLQDIRHAARSLRHRSGFALVVALTLALGVGATTAVFTVVNQVLLAPLPFAAPERLATLSEIARTVNTDLVSPITFVDWKDRNEVFSDLAAFRYWPNVTLENDGDDPLPRGILQITTTPNLFSVLGVKPVLGRSLFDDGSLIGAAEAVISHDLWQRRYGGDPGIIGRRVRVHGTPLTIVGVMPPVRAGMLVGWGDLWSPLRRYDIQKQRETSYRGRYLSVVGRLKPRVTLAQAQERMSVLQARLAREATSVADGYSVHVESLQATLVGGMRSVLLIVLSAAVLAYLAACANVGNLMLARAAGREREVAMRLALGASSGRIVSSSVAEAVCLSLIGVVPGILVARGALALILSLRPDIPRFASDGLWGGVDAAVLAFAAGASVLSTLIASVAPLIGARVRSLQASLREGGRAIAGSTRGRVRAVFAAAQISLACVLVVGAALLAISLSRLLNADPGFRASGAVIAEYNNPRTWSAKDAERIASTRDLLSRVAARPGISAAGTLLYFPYHPKLWQSTAVAEGSPKREGEADIVYYNLFAGDYFAAMGIPLLAGRVPTDAEMWGPENRVAVVNRSLARVLFNTEPAVGKRFRTGEDTTWLTVIGVVGDVRQRRLDDAPRPEYYRPFSSMPMPFGTLVARRAPNGGSSAGDAAFASSVAGAMRSFEPALAAADVQPLEQFVATSETARRVAMTTLLMFAVITVALAALGLYGMMAYTVSERTSEIGVRMALGATASDVVRLFTARGLRSAACGVLAGLLLAVALWRVLSALLYGVQWLDATVFLIVPLGLLMLAAVASGIPALRAAQVSPTSALRDGG